jgi:riboflavin synthase
LSALSWHLPVWAATTCKVGYSGARSGAGPANSTDTLGHVDSTAEIVSVTPDGNARTFRFKPRDSSILRYIVEKGYVTIDGASLTVTQVQDGSDGWWEVMLIAYTQEKVVTAAKQPGEEVNVEVDQVGKYVEKSVVSYFEQGASGEFAILERMVSKIVDERLKSQGKLFVVPQTQ